FVGLDMRLLMTNNAVKRPAKLSQCERICSGPVENEISLTIGFENVANRVAKATHPFIIAVGFGIAMIRFFEGGQRFRTNSQGIVTGELVMFVRLLHRESC